MKFLKYTIAFLLLLLLIFFGKGCLTPSVSYDCSVMVDKPAKECWAVMSDESKMSEWINGFLDAQLISGTANTVGAKSKIIIEENGKISEMEETITAITPFEHLAMTFTMDIMNMDYEIRLDPEANRTKISTTSHTVGNGILAKSIISFMPSIMKAQEEKNLNNLKQLIEQNTTEYFPSTEEVVD